MQISGFPRINNQYLNYFDIFKVIKDSVMTGRTASALLKSTAYDVFPLILFNKKNNSKYNSPFLENIDRDITPDEIMEVQGIKITTPIRTIYDCIMDGNIEVYYETYHDMVGEYVTAEEVKAFFEKKGKMDIYEAAMEEINLPYEI